MTDEKFLEIAKLQNEIKQVESDLKFGKNLKSNSKLTMDQNNPLRVMLRCDWVNLDDYIALGESKLAELQKQFADL